MDLTSIKYIVTIAEEKKISKAAEKLFITSSALSQAVKKLEKELGIPVFEKINGHTFNLTDGGKIYVDAAKEILAIKDRAYRVLEDVQHGNRGSFIFGCSPKRGLAMLSNVFPQFYKAYPDIKIHLKEANLNTLYDSIIEGQVDIAVLTPLSDHYDRVNLEPLDSEELVFALPVDHKMAFLAGNSGIGNLTIEELHQFRDDNWMMTSRNTMLRNLTDQIFQKAGFFPEKVLLETSSTSPHISAIEEGIAVGLVPLPRGPRNPNMVTFHLEPRQYRRLYAAYRKSYLLSQNQRYFIDLMSKFYSNASVEDMPPHRLGW